MRSLLCLIALVMMLGSAHATTCGQAAAEVRRAEAAVVEAKSSVATCKDDVAEAVSALQVALQAQDTMEMNVAEHPENKSWAVALEQAKELVRGRRYWISQADKRLRVVESELKSAKSALDQAKSDRSEACE